MKPRFMLAPPSPVQSSTGEPTSSTPPTKGGEEGRGGAMAPAVQSWEQLSKYDGFKGESVEAGMAASFSMMIAHTQQVFILKCDDDSVQVCHVTSV